MSEDFVIKKGGDAGRLASEVAEIVFNSEVSDYEYFLARKRHFERLEAEKSSPLLNQEGKPEKTEILEEP